MNYAKKLGLVAVAALALAAFTGVASAAAAEFHSSAGSATLSGTKMTEHVFTTQGEKVTCETANFSGTGAESGTSATQEMHPEYSGCSAFGFNATVNTAGCQYNFHAEGGTVDLKSCTSGNVVITVSIPFIAKCVVNVKNQNGINGQEYVNATPTKVEVVTNSTNISSNVVTSTGACPLELGEGTSTYTGTSTVTANGEAAEIWVE